VSANAEPPEASTQASPGLADLSEQIASARAQSATAQSGADQAGPDAPGAREADGATAAARRAWPDHIGAAVTRLGTALSRPPVRLAATGVVLLLIAIVLLPSSVWTLPLVIVGALMVLVAWIGSRLHGHLRLEWGDAGAQVDFHAQVAAARHRRTTPAGQRRPVIAAVPEREDVIEGEAHTVEIDLGELKALIAAAEADEGAANSARGRLRRR
jgi:hypothetical protein